jgi:hypothetical protein
VVAVSFGGWFVGNGVESEREGEYISM